MPRKKSSRTSNRVKRLREEIHELKQHAESLGSNYRSGIEAERYRANKAEARLERHRILLAQFCASSTVLPVEAKIPYMNPHMRTPVREPVRARDFDADFSTYRSVPIEELMMIVERNPEIKTDMCKRMHFHVTNVPGKQDFPFGYAVTHHEVRSMIGTNAKRMFVQRIAEEISGGIWMRLFGEEQQ